MIDIPFLSLDYQHWQIKAELNAAFADVVGRGSFILGEEVSTFEKEFATYLGAGYCVAVGNGFDALYIALKVVGVGSGDEVIVPSHTCFATWQAVMHAGARPVPVEVDTNTFTLTPSSIEAVITPRTKAIVAVHLYGYPCAMDAIMAIARSKNLLVIEDNAQGHGARWKGKTTGSWGHINATSFYPTKNLGAMGDGGAITTQNADWANKARACRNYGALEKEKYDDEGINSRLDELQASFLRIKLKHLDEWNGLRKSTAKRYAYMLAGVGDVVLPFLGNNESEPVFHQFVIQTAYRDRLLKYLRDKGIGTAIHYPTPCHLQKACGKLEIVKGELPVAEKLSETILSLPIWPGLSAADVEIVAREIKSFFSSSYL